MGLIDVRLRRAELDNNYCLLLTANSVEKQAVKAAMSDSSKAHVGQATSGAYLGFIGNSLVLHLSGDSGTSQDRSIGRIANAFLRNAEMPKPRLVLLTGFCWRNPANTPPGVLLISNEVWCANVSHAKDGELQPQSRWQCSSVSIDAIQGKRLKSDLTKAVNVAIGPVASAEILYQDSHLRDQLVQMHPALRGGEMEGFAFLCNDFPWLVAKAASDAGGDAFNRDRQLEAAEIAASNIAPLLQSLERDESVSLEDFSQTGALRHLLEGETIEFNAQGHSINKLNDILDGDWGAQLEHKLKRYASPDGYGDDFLRHCVDGLLELTQNAIRHGRANKVIISFSSSSITLRDDGDIFEPRSLLQGGRGGARALKRFLAYEESGLVEFRASSDKNGNIYEIALPLAHAELDTARQNCGVRIQDGVIGVSYGRPAIVDFAPTCTTLYLDATRLRMSSRKFVLADEIKRLVGAGKRIYVGCGNADDVSFYKEEFCAFDESQVVVFLDSKLPPRLW
ncbi:hypothetical protein PS662_03287 [Pseudomonas fluorescens]|uniref:Uncharacterized protein n=1 Tax=Pseudomonas fluorescens TaxID=294 RepID=A0A5E6UIE3_PSEFL|nr:5'-methylthioadenosine/S-adenosylhomocysteine nucleosidase [Pseudomonas fluorescens]VVM99818.1 hypothetical protein PS662_03287 [Pseudomonas fluorescens]